MSDLTSGYNAAENIYLLPHFNALCGFREDEIAAATAQIARECDLVRTKARRNAAMMKTFYDGYRFSRRAEEQVYNPTLALYFLKVFQRDCRHPDRILDSNLAMDRGKLHYISRLPEGGRLIFDSLAAEAPVTISELADRFGVDDTLYTAKDTNFVASLLYYFGILTFGGVAPFGRPELRIPNLVIRRLYAESIREMLLPEGREGDQARWAAESLYQQG